MRILILGAGAIGGYFGARLIEAGHAVEFLVRPRRAALLAERGLRVISENGDFDGAVACTTTDALPAAARQRPFDLVLLSCKAYDLDSALDAIAPAVGEGTRVLPLLNGLRHLDALDARFGAARVLGGLSHISVTVEDDGAIRHFGTLDRLTFGARRGDDPRYPPIRDALLALRVEVHEAADVLGAMWDKFVHIATLAGMTCLMRASVGEIVRTEGGGPLLQRLFAECADTAAREGHPLSEIGRALPERLLGDPASTLKASMLRDIERGARTEVEHILGDMLARTGRHCVDAPLLTAGCAHVRVYEVQRANARAT